MPQYIAHVNDRDYSITSDELDRLDIIVDRDGTTHLIVDNRRFPCRLLHDELDNGLPGIPTKSLAVEVAGRSFRIAIADEVDQLVDAMGYADVAAAGAGEVLAPMPGLVIDVMVNEGDEVDIGTPLLVLEAMKMENVLKAETAGTVRAVHVAAGDTVDKLAPLIDIE